jgi:YD repeat-containing protein
VNDEAKPPYEFSYMEDGVCKLPPRQSFSQDHWGYSNGKKNASLIPKYKLYDPSLPVQWINLGKADREPDQEYMKAGIIKRIKYPTKGYTEFEFEANTVKKTISKPNVTPHPYDAFIEDNQGTNFPSSEEFIYIPAEGETLTSNVNVLVKYYIEQAEHTYLNEGEMYVALEDVTNGQTGIGNELVSHNNPMFQPFSAQEELLAGHTYRLHVKSNIDQQNKKGRAWINVYWEESSIATVTENKVVGGLRVKNIKNFDDKGQLVTQKHFNYNHTDDSGYSSGIYNAYDLPDPGDYVNTSILKYFIVNPAPSSGGAGGSGGLACTKFENTTKSISYSPVHQRGIPIGDLVTYEYVTEYLYDYINPPASNLVGKSLYQYSIAKDHVVPTNTPYNLDRSWLRGQLLNETHFSDDGQNIIKQSIYNYDVVVNVFPVLTGTRIYKTWTLGNEEAECYPNTIVCTCWPQDHLGDQQRNEMYQFIHYDQVFQWNRLKSITETMDDVTKNTLLFYEEDTTYTHSNVIAAEVENSNGEITKTEIRYAYETNNTELINRNMVGIPLESESFVNGNLIGGSKLTFNDFGSGLYLPKRFEEKLSDESYRLVSEIDEVNAKGRTTLSHTRDGIYSTVLWGYDNELPKAKVINNSQGISSAFYTSFEETDGTDDDKAISGTKVHIGNFSVSGITAGTYIKSYWENTGGSWEYQEETIVHNGGNIAFITSGKLDEVRIHPVGSQMQTNNFDPVQIRVVSQSDVNSTTSSYNYDDLGRLQTIKDKDKNIVQYNKYHYID